MGGLCLLSLSPPPCSDPAPVGHPSLGSCLLCGHRGRLLEQGPETPPPRVLGDEGSRVAGGAHFLMLGAGEGETEVRATQRASHRGWVALLPAVRGGVRPRYGSDSGVGQGAPSPGTHTCPSWVCSQHQNPCRSLLPLPPLSWGSPPPSLQRPCSTPALAKPAEATTRRAPRPAPPRSGHNHEPQLCRGGFLRAS